MKCPMFPKWTFGLMDPQVNSKITICLQVSGDYRLNFQNVSCIGISLLPLMARDPMMHYVDGPASYLNKAEHCL